MDTADAWHVYLLRCADGSLYTGIALDVAQRLKEHERGTRGAKYLRGRGPLRLVFAHPVGDRSAALKIEHRIKRWTKAQKERLLLTPERLRATLDSLRAEAVDAVSANQAQSCG